MQWEVTGADRESGDEKTITIEADNADSARRRANRAGIMVADVKLSQPVIVDVGEDGEDDDVINMAPVASPAAPHSPGHAFTAAVATPPPAPPPPPAHALGYMGQPVANPANPTRRPPPKYSGLTIASSVLWVIAVMCYALAVIVLAIGIYVAAHPPTPTYNSFGPPPSTEFALVPSIAMFIGFTMAGALYHGFSAGCLALRDIAQNSFKW